MKVVKRSSWNVPADRLGSVCSSPRRATERPSELLVSFWLTVSCVCVSDWCSHRPAALIKLQFNTSGNGSEGWGRLVSSLWQSPSESCSDVTLQTRWSSLLTLQSSVAPQRHQPAGEERCSLREHFLVKSVLCFLSHGALFRWIGVMPSGTAAALSLFLLQMSSRFWSLEQVFSAPPLSGWDPPLQRLLSASLQRLKCEGSAQTVVFFRCPFSQCRTLMSGLTLHSDIFVLTFSSSVISELWKNIYTHTAEVKRAVHTCFWSLFFTHM